MNRSTSVETQTLNSQSVLDGLKAELPSYLAKMSYVDPNINVLQWWEQNESALPYWAAAARIRSSLFNSHIPQWKLTVFSKLPSITSSKVHYKTI